MRRIVLQMSMSLDGYVTSDRLHPGMAIPEDDELVQWKLDRISNVGAHLMGRVTYQEMAAHWPNSDHVYAAPMNDIPKIVFSHTLTEAPWPETRIANGELATEIAALKQEPGPDLIAWGGATFASALASNGLVDEYSIEIQPVAIGAGQALFAHLHQPQHLELHQVQRFSCGAVIHVSRPRST